MIDKPPQSRGAQNRARLLDVGVSCVILGFVGILIAPPAHRAYVRWHDRFFVGSALLILAGIAFVTVWAILAVRAAWQRRRDRIVRGFDVLTPHSPTLEDTSSSDSTISS